MGARRMGPRQLTSGHRMTAKNSHTGTSEYADRAGMHTQYVRAQNQLCDDPVEEPPMIENQAMLSAIIADPNDDRPRLVYADWLEKHGQLDRARLIRVQIELARLPDNT